MLFLLDVIPGGIDFDDNIIDGSQLGVVGMKNQPAHSKYLKWLLYGVSKILDRIVTSSSTVSSHSALSVSLISTSSQSQPSGDSHSNEDIKLLLYKLFNRNETNFINVANNEVMM